MIYDCIYDLRLLIKIVIRGMDFANHSAPTTHERAPKIEILNVLFTMISNN